MQEIHYIGYHTKDNNPNEYYCFPAASNKMGYIISVLKNLNFKINSISLGESTNFHTSKKVDIDFNETIKYVGTFGKKNLIFSMFSRFYLLFQLFWYFQFNTNKKSTVIVYHSLAILPIVKFMKWQKKFNLIYEVEEIFSATMKSTQTNIEKELKSLNFADAYIFVNDLLEEKFNFKSKNTIVCYGEYNEQKSILHKKKNENIILVYAGVIADKNSDVYLSINTMKHLPKNYQLKIVGYGTKKHLNELELYISKTNNEFEEKRIFFEGKKTGQDYLDFLHQCDIGLSTRMLENQYSDFTFPSKVLVYLMNNLYVVCSKINPVYKSKVSDSIYFYEQPNPILVAKTIMSIDFKEKPHKDNVNHLHQNFQNGMQKLINNLLIENQTI